MLKPDTKGKSKATHNRSWNLSEFPGAATTVGSTFPALTLGWWCKWEWERCFG